VIVITSEPSACSKKYDSPSSSSSRAMKSKSDSLYWTTCARGSSMRFLSLTAQR
jgi:hypothetical protein